MTRNNLLGLSVASLMSCASLSAHAFTVPFAEYEATSSAPNLVWIDTGTGGALSATGGTSGGADVDFQYTYPSLASVGRLPAELILSATSSSSATSSVVVVQPGLNGTFSFIYTGTGFTANGHPYTTGADLLSGTFTDGTIVAFGSSGSAEDSIVGGGTVTFASSVVDFVNTGDEAFSIAFTSPTGLALSGSTLGGFVANSVGTYAVDAASIVPEPGLWAMLILGFVSLGAVLRARRGAGRAATSA